MIPQAIFESWGPLFSKKTPFLRIWLPCWKRRNSCGADDKPMAWTLRWALKSWNKISLRSFRKLRYSFRWCVSESWVHMDPKILWVAHYIKSNELGDPVNLHVSHWTNQPRENSNITDLHVNQCQSQQHANKKQLGSQSNQVNHCLSFCNAVS